MGIAVLARDNWTEEMRGVRRGERREQRHDLVIAALGCALDEVEQPCTEFIVRPANLQVAGADTVESSSKPDVKIAIIEIA
ncbi:MAG: hypothetical protein AB7R89_15095 [Dehalococcoidia bacterium]